MKKYIILSMLFTLFGLVSCYDDDSSLGTKVGDITIGPLEDASIISYSGNKLIREPEIETTYPDDQLTYAWYIYKEDQDKGFRTNPAKAKWTPNLAGFPEVLKEAWEKRQREAQ